MEFNINLLNKIKLVIWDLDETFWEGTLSERTPENPVIPSVLNINCVRKLAQRGIISSICSKNDCKPAEEELERLHILDYFVFNSINWESKGPRIKVLINDMGLRDTNVLFIDDNIQNLREAEFYSPNIMTATPEIINILYSHADEIGKDDSSLSRLNQYKVLELKRKESRAFDSNEDF